MKILLNLKIPDLILRFLHQFDKGVFLFLNLTNLYRARGKLKEFDKLPIPMKLIILDFYYNKGCFFNQKGLYQSLKNRNAKSFLQSMKRGMKDRDEWTLEKFKQIPSSFWGK